MRYRVKRNGVLFYGSFNHASITLSVGQIWERAYKPSEKLWFPFHRLKRQNVLIEVTNEDFERYFEPHTGKRGAGCR